MRLQVFLSHNGVCSRRQAMDIIQSGRVQVNGKTISEPSYFVDGEKDAVFCDGSLVAGQQYSYIMLHKPDGYTTTKADRFAKHTIYELIPQKYHHTAPVGRLDRDTEGLLLMTNDGQLTYQLTHPRFHVDKTYLVVVQGKMEDRIKRKIEKGLFLDHKKTADAKIKNIRYKKDETSFLLTIHEGRKRQIRRMMAKVGHKVIYLKRMEQGPVSLGTLKLGRFRELKKKEIDALKKIAF